MLHLPFAMQKSEAFPRLNDHNRSQSYFGAGGKQGLGKLKRHAPPLCTGPPPTIRVAFGPCRARTDSLSEKHELGSVEHGERRISFKRCCTGSAVFARLHGSMNDWSWPHLAVMFVVGGIFGLARVRSGSMFPPTVLHVTYNTVVVLGSMSSSE